jgi:tetratricopeptide (TPR) repeat protein
VQAILQRYCHRCHGKDGTNEGGVNYVANLGQLVARKKVLAGQPEKSKLVRRLIDRDDPMPPEGQKPRPGADEIALVRRWIDAGAPPAAETASRKVFRSPEALARLLYADLGTVAERDRRFTRYFTLVHLANAGLSPDELESYRHGLSKLVNSLSWGRQVVMPRAIDAEATLLRIDLRDFQWNEKTWEAVLSANPYNVAIRSPAGRAIAEATGCKLPYVRADWFVFAAARPPLYREVLQLPGTDAELERLLRIDVAENLRKERVARAGFNGSGVSRNNRLIERHESGNTVYWKSYDFTGNVLRQNLFAHPLGPGDAPSQFKHDGGEIIFNLPNGLQAYLLVDGHGHRIDKGPTAVVSDPRRPDRAVENGISCMSCHAQGIIAKADQVREHVGRNRGAFAPADVDAVNAIYPPADTLATLMRLDARRFQQAVAQTGAPLSRTEPVAALAARFEAEVDLNLAAAEAGAPPQELVKVLDRSPGLARLLGPLKIDGGTVQRQAFTDAFGDLAEALQLGEFLPPRQATALRLAGRGLELLRQGDGSGAIRAFSEALAIEPDQAAIRLLRGDAYRLAGDLGRALSEYDEVVRLAPRSAAARNNRGLTHHQKGDHDRAIDDFTEAVRIDPRLAVAFLNRGAARQARDDVDGAIADYTEALRLEPSSAVAFNNRGLCHLDRQEIDRALADFESSLRLDPRSAAAWNNRGLAAGKKGDHARAVADFTRAIALDGKFARAYLNRAASHDSRGDTARAAADRSRARELDQYLEP